MRVAKILTCLSIGLLVGYDALHSYAGEAREIKPIEKLNNVQADDQDDFCFWRHPIDPAQSLVIASDKKANHVFTYDLAGQLKQTIDLNKPGNIDIRQNVRLGGMELDLVVVNIRAGQPSLRVFSVNRTTGALTAVDAGGIATRPNYGGCLGYDKKQERLWFFCTSEADGVTQYELTRNISNEVEGREVRHWKLEKCEGAVVDDDALTLFVATEAEGIWRVGMLPDDPAPGKKIVSVGDSGLTADLEGMAIGTLPDKTPVFIVSSQGTNQFFVFERDSPYRFRGVFKVTSAQGTDGIDLIQFNGFHRFEGGVFGCHTDDPGHPILLSSWNSVVTALTEKLEE